MNHSKISRINVKSITKIKVKLIEYGRNLGVVIFFIGMTFLFNSCDGKTYTGCDCYSRLGDSKVQASRILTVSPSNIEATFSSDEQSGVLSADGGCHAEMTIKFRWADDSKAITNIRPPIAYEFQTLFGYFPTNLGMETMTINSDNIREYTIKVNEAEDASNPSATRYGVWVKYLNGITEIAGPISCEVDIVYNAYNESYHKVGCKDS
ncbi:hypothetical protein SAMN06298216_0694 [Spirosomataceae bacterium TFI 002]|nr:hypothetical protein SAMN06298216_0694 [Spirosomataceae bacterium TFI 002]